jgi:hypothetical protein
MNTHDDKKYVKNVDLSGLLFPNPGIKLGTIQLTQKTITNEKVLYRTGYWRFRSM